MFKKNLTSHFLACGAAEGITAANALDQARLAAGVGNVNLVETGHIIPPGCQLGEAQQLPEGALVPASSATITSAIPGEVVSAAVAVALPRDPRKTGVVMHYAATGHKEDIEAIARRMAEEAFRQRGSELKIIHSVAVQHRVEMIGAVIAVVVLT